MLIYLSNTFSQNNTIANDSITSLDEVIIRGNTILGNKFVAKNRTGAAYYLSTNELAEFNYTDINRALNKISGINFYEEDGFGLRPNISIRGTSPERSSKIAVMEDGILISPAPYSASSAYYFPTTGRIHAVEVLKGPAVVSQGPQTIGGAINLISTPIPEVNSGKFVLELGDNGMTRTHAYYGGTQGILGALIEVHEHSSDGFDTIANVGGDTGFDKSDLML